jgi:hypothetical protein
LIELFLVVEGATEAEFVRRAIAPHLANLQIWAKPIEVTTRRERDGRKRRGGGHWTKWEADIRKLLRDPRPPVRVTSMFDLYGLPKNFPQLEQHSKIPDTAARTTMLEHAMARQIGDERFLPYLQRHEFEALVLAALPALEEILDDPRDRAGLKKLRANLGDSAPEDVNDGMATAPSKRLQSFIPSYNPGDRRNREGKSVYGPQVTAATGLVVLRSNARVSTPGFPS